MKDHSIQAVVRTIKKHKRFLVSAHLNPDPDAMGSALALASLLKRLGKQAVIANQDGMPQGLRFFPKTAPIISRRNGFKPEVAMTVDVPLLDRLGSMADWVSEVPELVNIDHHVSNKRFGTINYVDPTAGATGEMVYRLYKVFRIVPTKKEAFCLYVTIVTDTGSFKYMNTTPEIHRVAAELIDLGVSPLTVSQALYEAYTAQDLKFLGTVLGKMKMTAGGKIAWLEVPQRLVKQFGAGPEVEDELVNYPRSVQSVEVAMVIREIEEPGMIRINFRSKGRVDVNQLARKLGGGGHKAAAGCAIRGTLSGVRSKVLKLARAAVR